MSQADPPVRDVGGTAGDDLIRGLLAPDLAQSADAYFAGFAWDATVDPERLAAEAYLDVVFGGAPGLV